MPRSATLTLGKNTAAYAAVLAARALQAQQAGDARLFANCSRELAALLLDEQPEPPAPLVRLARAAARQVRERSSPGTEAADVAARVLREQDARLVLADAANMLDSMPEDLRSDFEALERKLDRAGFMAPYCGSVH